MFRGSTYFAVYSRQQLDQASSASTDTTRHISTGPELVFSEKVTHFRGGSLEGYHFLPEDEVFHYSAIAMAAPTSPWGLVLNAQGVHIGDIRADSGGFRYEDAGGVQWVQFARDLVLPDAR